MNGSDVPANCWLICIIYVCYLLNHIACSKDSKNPDHSLTTDGGENGSPTGNSESSQLKAIATKVPNGFFRSRCDQNPSGVKLLPELDPNEKSSYFHHKTMGSG